MRVAVLGTGIMGAGMAANLARSGHDVVVWNRTRARAEEVADREDVTVQVADAPLAAADGADAVVTMLFDAAAVTATMTGAAGALAAPGAPTWVQASTVGRGIDALFALAQEAHWPMVDTPVLGTRAPAEAGRLTTLAAGAPDDVDAVRPLFDAWGERTIDAGTTVGDGSMLKLAVNAWIGGITAALAESLTVAQRLGVAPEAVLDALDGSPAGSPYAQLKGAAMIARDYPPAFPLDGMVKDVALMLDAAGELPGLAATLASARRATDAGYGEADMAAIIEGLENGA